MLPSEQRYQLGVSSSYKETLGHFDPYGDYASNPAGTIFRTFLTVFGAAYRVSEDWQAGVSLPVVTNQQHFTGKDLSATGVGDPSVEARYTLWEDLSFLKYRPKLSFYGGLRLPFGKSAYDSPDIYGTNVVGDGTFTAHLGVNASKIYDPLKISLDSSFFYPFEKSISKMRGVELSSPFLLRGGNRFQLIENATYLAGSHWSGSIGLKQQWILQSSLNGGVVDGSAARLFSTIAGINYFYNASWMFGVNYETPFPFYRYLANQPYSQMLAFSIIYGGF
ncbi:MAG: hypothetical protein AABZ06_00135 [Bdellovibrionota bacterium]